MKPYRCHTLVTAFRIKEVRHKPSAKSTWNGEWELVPESGEPATVSEAPMTVTIDNQWYLAQRPAAGGYYVVDGRGTATFMARDVFEGAYHDASKEMSDE